MPKLLETSAVDLNAVERSIVVAEKNRLQLVTVPTRVAREMYEIVASHDEMVEEAKSFARREAEYRGEIRCLERDLDRTLSLEEENAGLKREIADLKKSA